MRIVLTGAAGAPGRHLLDEFMRQAADVTVLRAVDIGETAIEQAGDVREIPARDARAITKAIGGADFVVHAHALTAHGLPRDEYEAANVGYATSLLDACIEAKPAGVVHVASTEAYGPGLPPWPVNESWAPHPQGPMQQSIATAEQAARTYRRRIRLAILRGAPVLSPHGGTLRRLARHFAARPKAGLVGGGRAPLSLVAGADLARAAWRMIEHFDATADQVFHAASAHTNWREFAEEACRIRDVKPQFWSAPLTAAKALDAVGGGGLAPAGS